MTYYTPRDVQPIVVSVPAKFTPDLTARIKQLFEQDYATISGLITGMQLNYGQLERLPPDAEPGTIPSEIAPSLVSTSLAAEYVIQEQEGRVVELALRDWFLQAINGCYFESGELDKAGISILWVEVAADGETVQYAWRGDGLLFNTNGGAYGGDLEDTPSAYEYRVILQNGRGLPIETLVDLTDAQALYDAWRAVPAPDPAPPAPGEVVNSL